MKKIKMKYTDITITAHNQREEHMARIFNNQLDNIYGYMNSEEEISKSLKKDKSNHWLVTEAGGIASAMYYLDMIREPLTGYQIWTALNEQ